MRETARVAVNPQVTSTVAGAEARTTDAEDNHRAWAVAPDGQNVSGDANRAGAQFDQYARQIGLDVPTFDRAMNSPEIMTRINRDKADGDAAKVSGTPTL